MRFRFILACLLAGPLLVMATGESLAKDVQKCQRGCHSRCHGVKNKAKCVAMCRRACR